MLWVHRVVGLTPILCVVSDELAYLTFGLKN